MEIVWCLALTIAFELLTCFLRFGLGLRAGRQERFLRTITFGVRIHHGYLGLVLLAVSWCFLHGDLRTWGLRIGIALVASDLMHHFLVLWPLTGSPQFDFLYPD